LYDRYGQEIVAYIDRYGSYNPQLVQTALNYIDKGIEQFPDRLDLWLGKAAFLGFAKVYLLQASTIIQILERSEVLNHSWLWADNAPYHQGRESLLYAILDYVSWMVK